MSKKEYFHSNLQAIREDLEDLESHPENSYPFVILNVAEFGMIRLTFFSFQHDTLDIYAAVGETDQTLSHFKSRLRTAHEKGKWTFAIIKAQENTYTLEIRENPSDEFPDLYAALLAQGAFK